MNLKKWIEEYYRFYKNFDLKESTIDSYLRNLIYIPDSWEYETVSSLDVQRLIIDLSKRLSTSTVRHVFQIIREPVEKGYLYLDEERREFYLNVKLPKKRKKLVTALNADELRHLMPELQREEFYIDVFNVLLNTGIRFCELAGLNNRDFVFSEMTLKIQRRYYRGRLEENTKSDSGIRVVPINDSVKNVILNHWDAFNPDKPLFMINSERVSYNAAIKRWHKLLKECKIKQCGLHVLRHTFATLLLADQASLKVVSSLLGHKSITITADIYCDVSISSKRSAVQLLDNSLNENNLKNVL